VFVSLNDEGKKYAIKTIIGGIPAYKITDKNWTNHLRWALFYNDSTKPLKLPTNQKLVEVSGSIKEL
jgi:hypothetical protein